MLRATGRHDPATTMEGIASGMQDFDPLKEQVCLPETGSGWLPSVGKPPSSQAVYSIPAKPCKLTLAGHSDAVTEACTFDGYVITASLDTTVKVWSVSTGQLFATLPCTQPVNSLLCTRVPGFLNRVLLLPGCSDGHISAMTLDLGSGDSPKLICTNVLACHLPNPIRAMAASPDGRHLATGCCFITNEICWNRTSQVSVRGTLKTWDLDSVIQAATDEKGVDQQVNHKSMRTMKQLAAAAIARKSTAYGRNAQDFAEEKYFGIRAIAYSPDNRKLVAGFGHPEDIGERDFKMTVVCCAETLSTLWADRYSQYQVNGLVFSHHGLGTPGLPWQLIVSSQGHLSKVALSAKGR